MRIDGPAADHDPLLELACMLPPAGEYVRVPFMDPVTGLFAVLITATAEKNAWGPLQTIQIAYSELRARALLVKVSAVYKAVAGSLTTPGGLIVTVDTCVNDGGIEMIYDSQLLLLDPIAGGIGLVGTPALPFATSWYESDLLIVLLRDDPQIRPAMQVTVTGRVLVPGGLSSVGDTCQVAIVVELAADSLYDPPAEGVELLRMMQGVDLDTLDQRPTGKLRELLRLAGVVSSPKEA